MGLKIEIFYMDLAYFIWTWTYFKECLIKKYGPAHVVRVTRAVATLDGLLPWGDVQG